MTYDPRQHTSTPQYQPYRKDPKELWEQVYNMVDSKIFRLSAAAYMNGKYNKREKRVEYTLPDEVHDLVKLLGEVHPDTPKERLEQIAGFATSPAINQAVYGSTL